MKDLIQSKFEHKKQNIYRASKTYQTKNISNLPEH